MRADAQGAELPSVSHPLGDSDCCLQPTRNLLAFLQMDRSAAELPVGQPRVQDPILFAAIAPVAAHHKVESEAWLVSRLCDVPTFVIHSGSDRTCRQELEEPLWGELSKRNKQFHKKILTDVDHCVIHAEVYGGSRDLYDFFLARQAWATG